MTTSHCYADQFKLYLRAGTKKARPDELRACSKNELVKIRLRAAENSRTPVDCLEELAHDSDADVRIAVALNPSTPLAVKAVLATDDDPTVRHGIAEEPSVAVELLQLLADDCNPYVSCRAHKTLELLDAAKRKNEKCRQKFKMADLIKRPRRILAESAQSFFSGTWAGSSHAEI